MATTLSLLATTELELAALPAPGATQPLVLLIFWAQLDWPIHYKYDTAVPTSITELSALQLNPHLGRIYSLPVSGVWLKRGIQSLAIRALPFNHKSIGLFLN